MKKAMKIFKKMWYQKIFFKDISKTDVLKLARKTLGFKSLCCATLSVNQLL